MTPFGFSLIPRNARFYDRFLDLAGLLRQSSEATCDLLEHYEDFMAKAALIADLETQADDVTHSIYTMMNQTFLTPIDREDIAALAQRMDDVVDCMEAATTAISVYGIREITPEARGLAELLRLQCIEVEHAIQVLHGNRHLNEIIPLAREINRLENEGDSLFLSAMADLFRKGIDATEIIKWREIYDEFENALDSCENVSHVLEGIVLKHG